MDTILFLTDFSTNATYAAEYGYSFASQIGANIVLCNAKNVLDEVPLPEYMAWPIDGEDIWKDISNMKLMNLKKRLESISHSGFQPTIKNINPSGKVDEVVITIVETYNVGMIVMGTHESGRFRDFLLSNHNQSMINQTPVPLLLVPPVAPVVKIQRIAFATDLQQINIDLEYVFSLVALAKLINADIIIAHIGNHKKHSKLSSQQHEQLLTQISNKADYPHIYYRFLNNHSTEAGLHWLCAHGNINILAIVPRKRNVLESLLKGSLTQKMAKHLSIPLLVFPPR
jgi:nucleotide-binding universal stress UspA family protein